MTPIRRPVRQAHPAQPADSAWLDVAVVAWSIAGLLWVHLMATWVVGL